MNSTTQLQVFFLLRLCAAFTTRQFFAQHRGLSENLLNTAEKGALTKANKLPFQLALSNSSREQGEGPKKICILGGGFGGVNAALTLADLSRDARKSSKTNGNKPTDLEITVIDRKDRFVFLPLLYELCVNDATEDEVAPTFTSLFQEFSDTIRHERGNVAGVDVKENCVYYTVHDKTTGKTKMERKSYDSLIISSGIEASLDSVPGSEGVAQSFYTLDDCYKLRRKLDAVIGEVQLKQKKDVNVVVIGGGYSGVELALNLKEYLIQNTKESGANVSVSLVQKSDDILRQSSEFNRKSSKERLRDAKVDVITNTAVKEVIPCESDRTAGYTPCEVLVEKRTTPAPGTDDDTKTVESKLYADILLWTAGANPPKNGVLKSLLPRDDRGRILVDKTLQVKGIPNVFAIGDCAVIDGDKESAATAQVAIQQAPIVAWNAYASLCNEAKPPSQRESFLAFKYLALGEMMTLGSEDATINALGGLFQINGPAASVLRRGIYGVRMPTNAQRIAALQNSVSKRLQSTSASRKK